MMQHREIAAMMGELAPVIREFCALQAAPLLKRIEELEKRQPQKGERGEKGDPGERGIEGIAGRDGKDIEPEAVAAMVSEMVAKAVGEIESQPGPQGEAGPQGEPGQNGKDADPEMIAAEVAKQIAALELPKGEKGEPGDAGPEGPAGKDGAGIIAMAIDREGKLIATLTNGDTRDYGVIVGKDGRDGVNGADGAPGRDGTSFSGAVKFELDEDGRTLIAIHQNDGEPTISKVVLPYPLDRGVFKDGETYQRGDGVTWGGSFWIAQEETKDKPDGGKSWRLSVKRGRDGKDGQMKPPRENKPVKV